MTVAELRQCLSSLADVIRVGGKRAADDLAYVHERLAPFAGYELKQFGDFLAKAEAFDRLGHVPVGKRPAARKPAADPDAVAKAAQVVMRLYERATDPGLSPEVIEAEVNALGGMTKAQLDQVAKEVGLAKKFASKAKVIEGLIWKVMDRKGSFERAGA